MCLILVSMINGLKFIDECPYALPKNYTEDTPNKMGNIIELTHFDGGRAGNRFMTISGYLSMGVCCKSKLVILPEYDHENKLPHSSFRKYFESGTNMFDFSTAEPPSEFKDLHSDPSNCKPIMKDGGQSAFLYAQVPYDVKVCMSQVTARGCEKKYLDEITDISSCPVKKHTKDGSLVVHIRSGDIFYTDEGTGINYGGRWDFFGQPPLDFILESMFKKNWDDITILTYCFSERECSPTFVMLENMANTGVFGDNVKVLRNRNLFEDVREMICADGLVLSKSSLSFLTLYHTKAESLFFPSQCIKDEQKNNYMRSYFRYDNTKSFSLERPLADIYGIEFSSKYSVYEEWKNTPEQLLEMLTSNVEMEKCYT